MIGRRGFIATLIGASAVSFLPMPAIASETDQASEFINELISRAIDTLTGQDIPAEERAQLFRDMLREGLDAEHVAGFVLGPYRRRASKSEFSEFVSVLEDYVVATYARRLSDYQGQKFNITGAVPGKRKRTVVATEFLTENGPPLLVHWKVRRKAGAFKVVDITVEGLSMMVAQREEFVSVIRQGGGKVSTLITALKDKNQKLLGN